MMRGGGAGARQGGARHDDDRQAGKRLFERAACVHAGGKGRVRAAERELERTGGVFHRAAPAQALDDAQKHVNPPAPKGSAEAAGRQSRPHCFMTNSPLRRKDRPNRQRVHRQTQKLKKKKESPARKKARGLFTPNAAAMTATDNKSFTRTSRPQGSGGSRNDQRPERPDARAQHEAFAGNREAAENARSAAKGR